MAQRSKYSYPQPRKKRRQGSKKALIETAILKELAALGGHPTTVRFLYYRLVADGVISKSSAGVRQPAQDVSVVATELRMSGVIPLGSIVDRGRGTLDFTGWPTVLDGALGQLDSLRLDPWNSAAPQVWVESNSIASVVESIAIRYRVPLVALSGQASISLAHELSRRVKDGTKVIYLGDLDRSGRDIEASVVERVEALASVDLDAHRLAVTEDQVKEHGLTVIQKYDKRTRTHSSAVETEALGQRRIEGLIEDALDGMLADVGWTLDELRTEEGEQRQDVLTRLRP